MFKQNTVFIVGAGASQEFGFPVGWDLMQMIKANSWFRFERHGKMEGISVIRDAIKSHCSTTPDTREAAAESDKSYEALAEINRAIDSAGSIDEFINRNSHDPHIAEMGKLLIAYSIASAEEASRTAATAKMGKIDVDSLWQDTWISYFARGLFEGVRSTQLKMIGRGITIICFNYDRCIEFYLTLAIQQSFPRITNDEALEIVNSIDIIHPYGSLGRLPGGKGNEPGTVEFGPQVTSRYLARSTADLVTWSESIRDHGMVTEMRDAIRDADTIVFLGFAFAKQNLDLLGVQEQFGTERTPEVYGTAYGFGSQVLPSLKRKILGLYSNLSPTQFALNTIALEKDMTCRQFLKTHLPILVE